MKKFLLKKQLVEYENTISTPYVKQTFKNLLGFFTLIMVLLSSNNGQGQTVNSYTTAGNYTWTCPTGVTSVTVQAWAGGGGGGGTTTSAGYASGGAGGSYATHVMTVSPGTTYKFTIGTGGTAGTSGGNGGTGGSTFFGNTTAGSSAGASVLAVGGIGGNGTTAGAGTATGNTTGNIGTTFWSGGNGSSFSGTSSGAGGSGAGSTVNGGNASGTTAGTSAAGGGTGGAGRTNNGIGNDGTAPGGGGGGGRNAASTARAGGVGGVGKVVLTYTCPAISTFPWTENFDSATVGGPLNCWYTYNTGGSSLFNVSDASSNTYNNPSSTPNYLTIYYPTTSYTSYAITPGFNLTAGNTYTFSFKWAGDATSGWVGNAIVNNVQSATGATTLGTFVSSATTTSSAYTIVSYNYTPSTNGVYYFGFSATNTSTAPFYLGFDDLSVTQLVACTTPNAPTSLTFSNIGLNTINGSFTASSPAPTGYIVVRSTSATPVAPTDTTTYTSGASSLGGTIVTGNTSVVTATTYADTGLSIGTTYYYYVYAYNNTSCTGGPKYSSVLSGTQATLSCGSYSGTMTVGASGTFTNLTSAISMLGACSYTGNIVLELQSDYTSTGETFPITFPNTLGSISSKTITIRPASGVTPSITGSSATGIIFINGADYITFDGRPGGVGTTKSLTIENTNTSGYTIRMDNDATYNTVNYCTLKGVATATGAGVINFGSTAPSTGNDYNVIDNNNIQSGATTNYAGIYSLGSTTSPTQNNSNITVSNNNFFDYYLGSASAFGMNINSGNTDWTITGNSFYQTAGGARNLGSATMYGIFLSNSGGNFTINNNYIGGTAPSAGGTPLTITSTANNFYGIYGATATITANNIQGNTIANIAFATSTTSTFGAIYLTGGSFNIGNTTKNTIGNQTGTGNITFTQGTSFGGLFYGIYYSGASTCTISNNEIGSVTLNTASANTLTANFYGIRIAGGTNTISSNIIGGTTANSIQNLSGQNTTANAALIYGIYGTTGTNTVSSNTIRNMAYAATGGTGPSTGVAVVGISFSAGTNTISSNTINTLSNVSGNSGTTSSASLAGIIDTSSGTTESISNNTISGLTNNYAGSTTTSTTGIVVTSSTNCNISGNTISGLSTAVGSGGNNVIGLYVAGTTPSLSKNNIYDISAATTGAVNVIGINLASGTTYSAFNNFISDLRAPASSSNTGFSILGMNCQSGSGTYKVYYNTIKLGTTASPITSSGANFGVIGVGVVSGGSLDLRNTIININATPKGTGSTSSYYAACVNPTLTTSTAGTMTTNYSTSSNNNIFYINSGANNYLYLEGQTISTLKNGYAISGLTANTTNNIVNDSNFNTACGFYKLFAGGLREASTFAEDNLVSVATGTFAPSGASYAENGAQSISSPSITTDFSDVARTATTDNDMGALQFSGTGTDATAPTITYTAATMFPSTTSTCNFTVSIPVTDASNINTTAGTTPRIWFKKSTENNSLPATNTSADNGWKYVEATNTTSPFSFTIDYSLLTSSVVSGDVIQYFVVAQDLATNPNVATRTAIYASGFCPVSVALNSSAFPVTSPNSFTINTASSGITTATATSLCGLTSTTTLNITPSGGVVTGLTFDIQSSPTGLNTWSTIQAGATLPYTTAAITASTDYRIVVKGCAGTLFNTTPVTVTITNPSPSASAATSVCGSGTSTLTATAGTVGNLLKWYTSSTGGTLIGSGTSVTSPTISAATTYYVEESNLGSGAVVSGTGTSLTSSTSYPTAFDNYEYQTWQQYLFTASELQAMGLTSGNITKLAFNIASLPSPNNALTDYTIKIATTTNTALSSFITTGLTTVFGPSSVTAAIGVNTLTLATPYNWDGVSSIIVDLRQTGYYGSANATTYYTTTSNNSVLYAYASTSNTSFWTSNPSPSTSTSRPNITFTGQVISCIGTRVAVVVPYTTPPALTLSSSSAILCSGSPSSLITLTSQASDYDTYTWIPSTGVSGNSTAGWTFNPSTTTSYILQATNSSNGCNEIVAFDVTVNSTPTALTIAPATPSAICNGAIQVLTASGGLASSSGTIGSGTVTQSTTSYPNPFSGYYGGVKHQMIYTASELSAQGLSAGNSITSISFNISAFAAKACTNFTIRMKNTSFSTLSGFESGTTTVYNATTFTPSSTGWTSFTLSTPFVWDGTSNLIIETVHNAGNSGNGSGTLVYCSTTGTNQTYYGAKDSVSGGISGFDALSSWTSSGTSTSRPNIKMEFNKQQNVTWSPSTDLYTNSGGTSVYDPLVNTNLLTVYAKPSVTTIYTATATSSSGCTSTKTVTVTIKDRPTAVVSGSATLACGGAQNVSVALTGIAPWALTYTDGTTPVSVTGITTSPYVVSVSPSTTKTYTVTALSDSNCTAISADMTGSAIIQVPTATWDGTAWVGSGGWPNGTPPTTDVKAVINGAYANTVSNEINACTLEVTSNGVLTVGSDTTVTLQREVIASANTATFESGSSLIQNTNVTNTGNIVYKRTTPVLNLYDYEYWSTPIKNQVLGNIWMTTSQSHNYWYNNSGTPGWVAAVAPHTMVNGRGYITRAIDSAPLAWNVGNEWTASFSGIPNNGDIPYTVAEGDNLIGNPYPSALDLVPFMEENYTKLNGNFYFWTHANGLSANNTYNSDDYITYNVLLNASTHTYSGFTGTESRYVASGQAFFADGTASGGTITFKNSHRVGGNNTNFYKNSASTNSASSIESHKIWLNLTNNQGLFKQQIVAYAQGATNGYDATLEAKSFDGNTFADFYSFADSNTMTIQSKPLPFSNDDLVPLGYKLTIAGNFSISIDHFDGLFDNQNIYLEDQLLNVIHDLKASPYTFASAIGTFNNRFVLRYTNTTLNNPTFDSSQVVVYKHQQEVIVNSGKTMMSSIQVYDSRGRLIKEITGINATETRLNLGTTNQVLLLQITFQNGSKVTKKVVN